MGTLAKHLTHIDQVKEVVTRVLSHFDKLRLEARAVKRLSFAVDLAFADQLLFEKFEIWNKERDDDAFLFQVDRFFEKRDSPILTARESDLSFHHEEIETSIKDRMRDQQKRIFSERITQLAIKHDLLTNEQLGAFLSVSTEQARKYKSGEYKPQLSTLKPISEKFNVSIEFLAGISDQH